MVKQCHLKFSLQRLLLHRSHAGCPQEGVTSWPPEMLLQTRAGTRPGASVTPGLHFLPEATLFRLCCCYCQSIFSSLDRSEERREHPGDTCWPCLGVGLARERLRLEGDEPSTDAGSRAGHKPLWLRNTEGGS